MGMPAAEGQNLVGPYEEASLILSSGVRFTGAWRKLTCCCHICVPLRGSPAVGSCTSHGVGRTPPPWVAWIVIGSASKLLVGGWVEERLLPQLSISVANTGAMDAAFTKAATKVIKE